MRAGGECRTKMAKEIQRERRRVAFLVEGVGIEMVHAAPFRIVQGTAAAEFALDMGFHDLRALAPDRVATLVGEGIEEILEAAPAIRVAPLELPIRARQPGIV